MGYCISEANRVRAARIEIACGAVRAYEANDPYVITDLLTDLLHYCQQRAINFEDCVIDARKHFVAESLGEE